MAKSSIVVPSRVYAAGTRTVNLPNLTTDDNGVHVDFTRESWAVGTNILTGVIEGSNDSGVTWFNLTVFAYNGGDEINPRTQQPVLSSGVTCYWPESYDSQGNAIPHRPTDVRATVTNTVSLRTQVSLTGV